jgi:hypothetical protein
MKLYTEEQVLQIIGNLNREYFVTPEELLEEMKYTSIELPSDEEIDKEIEWLDNPLERLNFKAGIRWMRDKIRIQGR